MILAAALVVGVLAIGWLIYESCSLKKRIKEDQLGADQVIQKFGITVAIVLGVVTVAQSAAQYVLAAQMTQEQIKLQKDELADLRGQANYHATQSSDWTLTLSPIGPDPSPPAKIGLRPVFEDSAGGISKGGIVERPTNTYTVQRDGRWVLEITNAQAIICQNPRNDNFDCSKDILRQVIIEFERYGQPVTYSFHAQ